MTNDYETYDNHTRDQLIAALRDPTTKGNRGTIVYHLWSKKLDCSDIIPELVECIIGGSYEEVNHAVHILEEQQSFFNDLTVIGAAIDSLEAAPLSNNEFREDGMGYAHDYLSDRLNKLEGNQDEYHNQ